MSRRTSASLGGGGQPPPVSGLAGDATGGRHHSQTAVANWPSTRTTRVIMPTHGGGAGSPVHAHRAVVPVPMHIWLPPGVIVAMYKIRNSPPGHTTVPSSLSASLHRVEIHSR